MHCSNPMSFEFHQNTNKLISLFRNPLSCHLKTKYNEGNIIEISLINISQKDVNIR